VALIFNLGTWEAAAGGLQVLHLSELCSETLSQKQRHKQKITTTKEKYITLNN
jgi:hypothetical protein